MRSAHHWELGVEFLVEEPTEGLLLRPVKPFPQTRLARVICCVGYQAPAKSLEDMEAAIAAGVRAVHDRG